ncbi:hypothetical protein POTOM_052146 [Populus tomentosa]|uniref:Transducin/WD40 repeat-like superfamily protein n=1 Tax=Populus tomentosa TaxID=118781 RepID=A0A8X8C8F6_POPTO|nr:hypothetical protein POTOM_052146 [Populus tomentosa]
MIMMDFHIVGDNPVGIRVDPQTGKSVAVLKGNLGAIRSTRFTSDGQFMAMEEPADFCMCMIRRFEKEQEIDFFGEISVVSFSPDTESLFIGVWDRNYGSLFQYNRCRSYSYLDSLIRKEIENRHYTAIISCSVIMMGDIVREEEIGHDGIEPMESMWGNLARIWPMTRDDLQTVLLSSTFVSSSLLVTWHTNFT